MTNTTAIDASEALSLSMKPPALQSALECWLNLPRFLAAAGIHRLRNLDCYCFFSSVQAEPLFAICSPCFDSNHNT